MVIVLLNQDLLAQRDLHFLSGALELENLSIAKYSVYADQCADEDLKTLMFQIAKNKRQHADQIKQALHGVRQ
jgi:rubrerythrin